MAETETLGLVLAVVFTDADRDSGTVVLYQIDNSPVEDSTWGGIKAFFGRMFGD